MKLYLAGPMTGIPQFNYPAFDGWKAALQDYGYTVVAPHDEDSDELREAAMASESGALIDLKGIGDMSPENLATRNVLGVLSCRGVATMPDWARSSGVRHEVETAVRFGRPVAPVQLWIAAFKPDKALGVTDPHYFLENWI